MITFHGRRSARVRDAVTAGVTAALVLLAAGCGIGGSAHPARSSAAATTGGCQPAESAQCQPTHAAPPTAPSTNPCTPTYAEHCGRGPAPAAITLGEAQHVLASYVRVNNAANKGRNRSLNNSIETGAIHAQSQAAYTTYQWWTKHEKSTFKPFTYAQPHFYIPRASGLDSRSHPWFAVLAKEAEDKQGTDLMVFVEDGSSWKMSAAAWLDVGQTPTRVALDSDGYASAVDPGAAGLVLKPSALPTAVNDNYLTGGIKSGAVFGASPDVTQQRAAYKNAKTFLRPYAAGEFKRADDPFGEVYALRTVDGGALVLASSSHSEYDHVIRPGGEIDLNEFAKQRAWVSSSVQRLTTTWTCLDAASIPPRGTVDLLGSDCEITAAR